MTYQSWCRVMTPCFNKLLPFRGEVDVDIIDMVTMVGGLHHDEISMNRDLENTMTRKTLETSCVTFRDILVLLPLGLMVSGIRLCTIEPIFTVAFGFSCTRVMDAVCRLD